MNIDKVWKILDSLKGKSTELELDLKRIIGKSTNIDKINESCSNPIICNYSNYYKLSVGNSFECYFSCVENYSKNTYYIYRVDRKNILVKRDILVERQNNIRSKED